VDGIRVGLVGLSPADWRDIYEGIFRLELPDEAPVVRAEATALREAGAEVVIVLSHVGLSRDRELAAELAGDVDLIVGSHSHHLLPDGEEVDGVTIVQAGEFAEHLGRVELEVGGGSVRIVDVRVEPVDAETPHHLAVDAEVARVEAELEHYLAEIIGELHGPLELRDDAECAAANFMADVLRERMAADVGLVTAGVAFDEGLAAGPLTRGALYEACSSPGNPGAADLTGAQLVQLVARGLDPELAQDVPRTFRGAKRGLIHLSGAEIRGGRLLVGGKEVDPDRTYLIAASDWELDSYGGYADDAWGLQLRYDHPTILREAVEDRLRERPEVVPPEPRVHSSLDG
jgi:2',3'-cyclic-nucleotide 2'-phosphodiesterase (5'-nucleotidase family)